MRAMRRLLPAVLLLLTLPASAELRVLVSGGKSLTSWHGQADMQAVHFELGRALSRRTTVALVASPIHIWQPRSWFGDQYGDGSESVQAISAGLLVRRTFRTDAPLQWYLEGSTGPMVAEKRVPASTSHFNFITMAGTGIVFRANGHLPVIAGFRFMHISNGGYAPRNPGLGVCAVVIGVQLRNATMRRH
jgi:Lipid A 3-O-deacylase (PagL)